MSGHGSYRPTIAQGEIQQFEIPSAAILTLAPWSPPPAHPVKPRNFIAA